MFGSKKTSRRDITVMLDAGWPEFLDLLDSDPARAYETFYVFAAKLMAVCPPRVVQGLPPEEREDLLHDLVFHCCENDFRILRKYVDQGKPFAAWLQLVIRNKALDRIRSRPTAAHVPLQGEQDDDWELPLPDVRPLADEQVASKRNLELVRGIMCKLSDKCRVLIQAAAEGFKPRELTLLMGWPPEMNKKASDDLRECRRTLTRMLKREGLDLASL